MRAQQGRRFVAGIAGLALQRVQDGLLVPQVRVRLGDAFVAEQAQVGGQLVLDRKSVV